MQGKVFLGRYKVIRLLGEGGMGRVYLARQLDLNRDVVVKVMHDHVAADPRFQERFQQEMLMMAQFQHPYAVSLYDAQINPAEGPCIIMEYVKGKTLDLVLRENKRFTPERASRLLGQLCEVLSAAHELGIVHRDLKPSNLMIMEADTQFEKVKVMDFGLARLHEPPNLKSAAENAGPTDDDGMLGTPAYVSPEQARGEDSDHRADIYSLGVILYEMLTGRLPFEGLTTMDTLLAHAIEQPPPMSSEDFWIPPAVEECVLTCLAKQPSDRFQSARQLHKSYMDALAMSSGVYQPTAANSMQSGLVSPIHGIVPAQGQAVQLDAQPSGLDIAPPSPDQLDPALLTYQMQAWLPRSIASVKLAGFIHDARGEIIENSPGRIRVLLGARNAPYSVVRSGWFGFGGSSRPDIEMELQLAESTDPKKPGLVWLTVLLRYVGKQLTAEWRERGEQIYRDLRGYLIGNVS